MRVDSGFLERFVARFGPAHDQAWFLQKLERRTPGALASANSPRLNFDEQLEQIYIPTPQAADLAMEIAQLAREAASKRYVDPAVFVDICYGQSAIDLEQFLACDTLRIIGVDGLPGRGRSSLFRRLAAILPQNEEIAMCGNPPQRVTLVSALFLKLRRNFSLKEWLKTELVRFGVEPKKIPSGASIGTLLTLLRKALYCHGVVLLVIDELQFYAGTTGATKAIDLILDIRMLGLPIAFFANTDLFINMKNARAQMKQRVPTHRRTLEPLSPDATLWAEIVAAQVDLFPLGHTIDIKTEAANLGRMLHCSPRACGRLISIGGESALREKRSLRWNDLLAALHSEDFAPFRNEAALLSSPAPIDAKANPEMTSANTSLRARSNHEKTRAETDLNLASGLALQSQQTPQEHEVDQAFKFEVLRKTGKLPANIESLAVHRRGTKSPKKTLDRLLEDSMYNQFTVGALPPSTTSSDAGDQ